jgi:lactonase
LKKTALRYQKGDQYSPLPLRERGLPTVIAEPFAAIEMPKDNPAANILEGLNIDQAGNLYVCCPPQGDIYRIKLADRTVTKFTHLPDGMLPSALKVHQDGRLFVTAAWSNHGCQVAVLDPQDGRVIKTLANLQGRMFDDLAFDSRGGFYLSDLSGTIAQPTAGIFYVEPDEETVRPVVDTGLIATNGISLDPQEQSLWVTEYGRGRLLHFRLGSDRTSILPSYSNIPYYFTGLEGPDSLCVDRDGNVYVSMCGQGRFLVFNANGIPIGQILLPGRDHGDMLKSTHITIRPGTNEAYMCSSNLQTGRAMIFRAHVYADAK